MFPPFCSYPPGPWGQIFPKRARKKKKERSGKGSAPFISAMDVYAPATDVSAKDVPVMR